MLSVKHLVSLRRNLMNVYHLQVYLVRSGLSFSVFIKQALAHKVNCVNTSNVESPTMTRTLTRMESMGWIIRTEGKDRREKLISLSETALEMIPVWQQEVVAFEEKALQNISKEEMQRTFQVLQTIIQNLNH